MHYLVTGGAGFIGSHLCDALLEQGHRVSVIDDFSTGHAENLPSNAVCIEGDCGNAEILRDIIPQVDGVFHLAAVASVQKSREEWRATSLTNLLASVAILDAMSKNKEKIPFVYASSAAVYGDPEAQYLPITENTPTVPLTPYGADKLACELHAKVAHHTFNIPTMGLRFFNVYGPRQDPFSPYSGVISIFSDKIPKEEPITIFGDGQQSRDFIYVADVVRDLSEAMKYLQTHGECDVVNICTGKSTNLLELAHLISTLSGKVASISHGEPRIGDIRHSQGNNHKLESLFGVKDYMTLQNGLAKTLRSLGVSVIEP